MRFQEKKSITRTVENKKIYDSSGLKLCKVKQKKLSSLRENFKLSTGVGVIEIPLHINLAGTFFLITPNILLTFVFALVFFFFYNLKPKIVVGAPSKIAKEPVSPKVLCVTRYIFHI